MVTTDKEHDVQFDDLEKAYYFGIAVFDNDGGLPGILHFEETGGAAELHVTQKTRAWRSLVSVVDMDASPHSCARFGNAYRRGCGSLGEDPTRDVDLHVRFDLEFHPRIDP